MQFVTVRELASLLKRSPRSLYDDIAAGRIQGVYRLRRSLRVNLDEALQSLRQERPLVAWRRYQPRGR